MNTTILMLSALPEEANNTIGYIVGAIIALIILGYLFYSLFKPEKF